MGAKLEGPPGYVCITYNVNAKAVRLAECTYSRPGRNVTG